MSALVLAILHWLAGLVVLAEALNKLERADLFDGRQGVDKLLALRWLLLPWRWPRPRIVTVLKACGWALLALGAGGALATPLLHLAAPTLQDAAVLGGFAILIIRSRVKELP